MVEKADFACLFCFLESGDKVIIMDTEYKIIEGFQYDKITNEYNYTKKEISELRKNPNFSLDPDRIVPKHKKFPIPEIREEFRIITPTVYTVIFEQKTYKESDIFKLSKHIAKKYVKNTMYRNYVDTRLEKLKGYDYMGRKTNMEKKVINGWNVLGYLSTGLFGATYIVSKNGGKEYIMKTFHTKSGKRAPSAVEKECRISKLAGELGVGPKVIECQSTSSPQYIVMQKLEGPLLSEYESYYDIPMEDIRKFEKAMAILDQNKIKHNDLHLGNVMYHKDKIYIIDYGKANIVKSKVKNNIKM
jgi:predicted Ser/Thr protein kinase